MADTTAQSVGKFTTGPVSTHLRQMTIPMIWGIFAVVAVNVTDTFFVARLGTLPLAAMGFAFPVAMIMFALGIGLSAGTTSVIARAIGRNDKDRVKRLTTDALSLAFAVSSLFALIGILTIDPAFRLLGADDATMPYIRAYMVPWYIGIVFLIVPMVGNGALRACGDAKWPSIIMIGSAAMNAVLDPILIFGLLGAPRLEIAGAAWATLIARVSTLVAAMAILHFREKLITTLTPGWACFVQSGRDVLHVAVPATVTQILNPVGATLLTAIVASSGTGAVAAFGVAVRIEGIALVILYALSAVIGSIAGQNWGAGLISRSREALLQCFWFCAALGATGGLILFFAASFVTPLFDPDPEISRIADLYLRIVPWSFAFHGAVMVACAFFNGVGMPGPSLLITFLRVLCLMVPFAYLGDYLAGLPGIFWAIAAANLLSGIVSIVWSLRTCQNALARSDVV